jgi:hypothetical protein
MNQQTTETETMGCPICTRADNDPYRVYDERGEVIQGCVAAYHNGRLQEISASARWHNRKEAKAIRRSMAAFTRRNAR